ncbi:MAG TPA: hypothetical protein VHT29_11495 [Solirubrobacteraceae bacterium]|nr:hypothetical protein [Solirubrobacteraceae bacterium]
MGSPATLAMTLLGGAQRLLEVHARELPQRDDLCGAFCGALALQNAGLAEYAGEPLDQDAVALAAGSVVSGTREAGVLPDGESGRRDYRLAIPTIEDSDVSGTTAAGVQSALETLSEGALVAIALAGPWTGDTLGGLYELVEHLDRPVTLIANLATHHLWGSHPSASQLLAYLLDGEQHGPAPDWRVGHFVCIVGRISGPGGILYTVADTYPSLGDHGVHLQPREHLAAALERRDMPAGGVLAVVASEDAPAVREGARELGLREEMWDNGTIAPGEAG